jgi:hypothetical protein
MGLLRYCTTAGVAAGATGVLLAASMTLLTTLPPTLTAVLVTAEPTVMAALEVAAAVVIAALAAVPATLTAVLATEPATLTVVLITLHALRPCNTHTAVSKSLQSDVRPWM